MQRRSVLATMIGMTSVRAVRGAELAPLPPTPTPFLSISGLIGRSTLATDGRARLAPRAATDTGTGTGFSQDMDRYDFTEAAFLGLPTATITTSTVWTPRSVFVGPRLLTVMQVVGASSGTLIFRTLDDYSAAIPWSDLVRYGVILAHSQDGQRLSNKRWGPLWTMYPRDRYPHALSGPIAESRFIWQVNRIEVSA